MNKILFWTVRIVAIALLIVPLLLCFPGTIIYFISEYIAEKIGY